MQKLPVFVRWLIVVILQLIAMQVVTFAGSFLFPNMEQPGLDQPIPFAIMLGVAFTLGIFLVGSIAIRYNWLNIPARWSMRLAGTLIGVYLILFLGVAVAHTLPAGSPFFGISMLTGLLGFHLPSWIKK